MRVLLFILILATYSSFGQNERLQIGAVDYQKKQLTHVVDEIESEYNVHFYYKQNWLKDITITYSSKDSIDLNTFLNSVLNESKLQYWISGTGNVYLFPKDIGFTSKHFFKDSSEIISENIDQTEDNPYIQSVNANVDTTIVVGDAGSGSNNRKVNVSGYIFDDLTSESLVGATIYIPELEIGAVSNDQGILEFKIKPGDYSAQFKCMGMNDRQCKLRVLSAGKFTISLYQSNVALNEIVVEGNKKERGSTPGLESVDFMKIKEIPVLMGEKDVIKIAQMLPGIVSVGEGSGGINVRGGNADQNLFYLNDIPVYNNSHLFGFFSSVNSNVVERFSVYKGYIPVEFGGRLSSVFDIEVKQPSSEKVFGQGSISPISGSIALEVPVVKNKLSILASARSTYSDWIFGQINDPDIRNSNASFNDYLLGIDYKISDNQHLKFLSYKSNDEFDLSNYNEYVYGNFGGALSYVNRFNQNLRLKVALINSSYNFTKVEKSSISDSYQHNYKINHAEFKSVLDLDNLGFNKFTFGLNSILYNLDRGQLLPYGSESVRRAVQYGFDRGLESSLFLNDEISLGSRLKLNLGIRYSMFNELGPKTVYEYAQETELVQESVVDTVLFSSNEIISTYHGPELRAGMEYKLSPQSNLKVSFTQMRQYIYMLSNTFSIAPTDQWKLVDGHIKPLRSNLLSLGYYYSNPIDDISFSTEIYGKLSQHVVAYKDGADFVSDPYVERIVLQGDQRGYGIEFLLSKDDGNLNGWISYAYSRSMIKVDGTYPWDRINNGAEYPANFDKPHVLNLVLNYKLNRRFSLSSNVVYSSGRPITFPIGYYYMEDQPYIDYSSRNQYRIPDYFRTDFSLKIEGNLKRKKAIHSYWSLSVYNLLGRNNSNSVFFQSKNSQITGYSYAVIGVPIYTLSWNWKLGNYANR